MLNAYIQNYYDRIVVKVNPHVEANKGVLVFLLNYDAPGAEILRVVSPGMQAQKEIDKRINQSATDKTLVVMEVTKIDDQGQEQMFVSVTDSLDAGHRDLWLLKAHLEGRNTDNYSGILDRLGSVDLPKELRDRFDSITIRINPHKTTGLSADTYIREYNNKGFDETYGPDDDNRFSDDPTYEKEINLCSVNNRLYTTTAYWKDVDGNRMCHDVFAHDYSTILKELREIADERNR
jgi:hypothetical protein